MIEHPFTIIHIPHSSIEIPADLLPDYLISREELDFELLRMTDRYTDELFDVRTSKAVTVRFPVSRLVVDPERFSDDSQEIMAHRGMGAVYTRSSDLNTLRVVDEGKRQQLLERYYHPYHRRLNALTDKCLQESGKCLIIDGHSFPSVPLPYELDQSLDRPGICIGTDPFHTPDWLKEFVAKIFRENGFSVALNHPFPGSLVPSDFYLHDERVVSIMIEIRRDLYVDEPTGSRLDTFQFTQDVLRSIIMNIITRAGVAQ